MDYVGTDRSIPVLVGRLDAQPFGPKPNPRPQGLGFGPDTYNPTYLRLGINLRSCRYNP